MRPDQLYLPTEAAFPFEGLDVHTPSTLLDPGASPNAVNLTTFRGSLKKRNGYSQIGTALGSGEKVIQLFNLELAAGTNILCACTPTKIYSWDGASWTDRTPSSTAVQKFTKSGSNGWSVSAGSLVAGQFVTQATSGAVGVWLTPDATYYYVYPLQGLFDQVHVISVVTTSGSGSISLTGTDPSRVAKTLAAFPIQVSGVGWTTVTGVFDVGLAVIQSSSGATGVWAYSDSTNYYVTVTSGTFDKLGDITVTSTGHSGTLSQLGQTAGSAPTSTRYYPATATQSLPFHGTDATFVDWVAYTDENAGPTVVVTNGIDPPVYWDGITATFSVLSINLTGFLTAKAVGTDKSYLVFGNITTQTDIEPRTVTWSDTGNFAEWLGGNSGTLEDISLQGDILKFMPFADNLIVFATGSITCLCYINSDIIFGTQVYVSNIKVVSARGICSTSGLLLFVSQENIFSWDGSRGLVIPIADRIAPIIQSVVSSANIGLTQLFWDSTLSQVRLSLPTSSTAQRHFTLEYVIDTTYKRVNKYRWFEQVYNDSIRSMGIYNQTSGGQNFFNFIHGADSGKVFIELGEANDAGTLISPTWDTQDFTPAQQNQQSYQSQVSRWIELECELDGTTCDVSYSTDHGQNWTAIQTLTLTTVRAPYKLYFDTSSRFIRFRFRSSVASSALTVYWYRVWYRAGGAR